MEAKDSFLSDEASTTSLGGGVERIERRDQDRSLLVGGSLEEQKFERPDHNKPDFSSLGNIANFNAAWHDSVQKAASSREVLYSHLAMNDTKVSLVERSWYKVSGNIGDVATKCFMRMFKENPDMVALFPFGEDSVDPVTGRLKINQRTNAHVRAHATAVMQVVGACVAGLTSIEDLIPRLRNVGASHKTVGVQPRHYDILYKHMVQAIREEVGHDKWDQETEDAWEQAYVSISDMIKRPSKRLETEPLRGWGIVMLLACTYFILVTPFELAGYLHGHHGLQLLLAVLDALGALVMALDLTVYLVQTHFVVGKIRRLKHSATGVSASWLYQFVCQKRKWLVKILERYRLMHWAPWYSLDLAVLLSFILQWMFLRTSICAQVGLHPTQLFGLLRVLCVMRVSHFLQCAENNALIEQKLSTRRQLYLRLVKLVLRLAFIIHLAACMWCMVARLEIGADATEFEPTPFFPKPNIIHGSDINLLQAYSQSIHWAFVNLSGIGNVNSEPMTTLEVWCTLIAHMIGAIFYAFITGNVISILEDETKQENKMGSDIVKLSRYLQNARVSPLSKDRIMKGFMLRNVLTEIEDRDREESAVRTDLDLADDILDTLPRYLRLEIGIYARAELIHRNDKFFAHCSQGFLVELSSKLSRTQTLLTGDYLIRNGESYQPEFILVESGSLQVTEGGHTIKTLSRGECIGKAWLLQLEYNSDNPSNIFTRKTFWLMKNGQSAVSIRALSPCTLRSGLSSRTEVDNIERAYKPDFQLLRAQVQEISRSLSERKAIAVKVIARGVRQWKTRKQKAKNGNQTFVL